MSGAGAGDALALSGRRIAVPESRQLDVLAEMLGRRGAEVLRCPLVAIRDAPDPVPVEAWIERAIATPPFLFVLYTGEGVKRLVGFAERAGRRDGLVAALAGATKLCRGPKPVRALKALGLDVDIPASAPTTAGIVETLDGLEIAGKRVCVQLYSPEPVPELADCLARGGAETDYVAPYVYASEADDAEVVALIDRLDAGALDAIAFTSKSQVERLFGLAREHGIEARLVAGLAATCVAAVGPVVAAELEARSVRVDATPAKSYFMKPLVSELAARLAAA